MTRLPLKSIAVRIRGCGWGTNGRLNPRLQNRSIYVTSSIRTTKCNSAPGQTLLFLDVEVGLDPSDSLDTAGSGCRERTGETWRNKQQCDQRERKNGGRNLYLVGADSTLRRDVEVKDN